MKYVTSLALISALLINSACTPILKEVRYPGGYPGYLLDRKTFDASASKQLMLLRATLILAMAAEMSRVTVNGEDADSFAKHLSAAVTEINYAAGDLYPSVGGEPCRTNDPKIKFNLRETDADCSGFYANFEGDIPLIEARIVKVMLAALPTDKARKFLDAVAKGDVFSAAWSAIGAVAVSVGGLHFALGRYRSGLEIVAENMGSNCSGPAFNAQTMSVVDAANCMGLSQDDLFDRSNLATAMRLRGDNPGGQVRPRAFLALLRTVAAACVDLPYAGDVAAIADSRNLRGKACNPIGFAPTARPYRISVDGKALVATETSVPANAPTTVLTPTLSSKEAPKPIEANVPATAP